MRTKIALSSLKLDRITAVEGIELDPGEEDFAGGKMQRVFERLGANPDPRTHHPFLVIIEREVVGFLMSREGAALPVWANPDAISLHNFRMSRHIQGRGHGTSALVLAARWITFHRPDIFELMLSVNAENTRASRLYQRCGFRAAGRSFDGRLGREFVLSCNVIELAARPVPDD
jgi:ribosomal protein S18 acetylase RimI-like enzyme